MLDDGVGFRIALLVEWVCRKGEEGRKRAEGVEGEEREGDFLACCCCCCGGSRDIRPTEGGVREVDDVVEDVRAMGRELWVNIGAADASGLLGPGEIPRLPRPVTSVDVIGCLVVVVVVVSGEI